MERVLDNEKALNQSELPADMTYWEYLHFYGDALGKRLWNQRRPEGEESSWRGGTDCPASEKGE